MRHRASRATRIAAALAALASVSACGPGASSTEVALPVHVETVVAETTAPGLVLPGVVESRSAQTLSFAVGGRLARFLVPPGSPVAAGEAIAELDRAALGRNLAAARAVWERAHSHLVGARQRDERHRDLLELAAAGAGGGAADEIAVSLHAAEVRQARATLDRAEERLAAAVLRAPAAGLVERRYAVAGEELAAGTPVVRLVGIDRLTVRSAVPRALASLAPDGREVRVRLAGGPEAPAASGVIRRLPADESPDGLVPFEVQIDDARHGLLPQMLVEVSVALAPDPSRFTVPLSAVRRGIDDEPFAFVVIGADAESRVERRGLVLGGLERERVAVVVGLAAGDRVVSRGAELLLAGDAVAVVGEGP